MDEIEFKNMYLEAANSAKRIVDSAEQYTIMHMLQMIWDLHERMLEMQVEEDDE